MLLVIVWRSNFATDCRFWILHICTFILFWYKLPCELCNLVKLALTSVLSAPFHHGSPLLDISNCTDTDLCPASVNVTSIGVCIDYGLYVFACLARNRTFNCVCVIPEPLSHCLAHLNGHLIDQAMQVVCFVLFCFANSVATHRMLIWLLPVLLVVCVWPTRMRLFCNWRWLWPKWANLIYLSIWMYSWDAKPAC